MRDGERKEWTESERRVAVRPCSSEPDTSPTRCAVKALLQRRCKQRHSWALHEFRRLTHVHLELGLLGSPEANNTSAIIGLTATICVGMPSSTR